jgi:hypothetical protein
MEMAMHRLSWWLICMAGMIALLATGALSAPPAPKSALDRDDRLQAVVRLPDTRLSVPALTAAVTRETGAALACETPFEKQLIVLPRRDPTARQAMEALAAQLMGTWRRVQQIYALEPETGRAALLLMDAEGLRAYGPRWLGETVKWFTRKQVAALLRGETVRSTDLPKEARDRLRTAARVMAIESLRAGRRQDLYLPEPFLLSYDKARRFLLVHVEGPGTSADPVAACELAQPLR